MAEGREPLPDRGTAHDIEGHPAPDDDAGRIQCLSSSDASAERSAVREGFYWMKHPDDGNWIVVEIETIKGQQRSSKKAAVPDYQFVNSTRSEMWAEKECGKLTAVAARKVK